MLGVTQIYLLRRLTGPFYHLDKLIFTIYGINTLSAIGFLLLLKQGMLECGSKKIPLLETNIKMPSNGFRICSMANDIFVCISSESVQKFSVSKTYVYSSYFMHLLF